MVRGCGAGHEHKAATICRNWPMQLNQQARSSGNFSEWFLPSVGQWILAMKGLGYNWSNNDGWGVYDAAGKEADIKKARDIVTAAGVYWDDNFDVGSWTSSANNVPSSIITMGLTLPFNMPTILNNVPASVLMPARPFIAFKYDGGAY